MNPKEWTRIGLIMEIRQVWRDYGRPQLKGLDRVRKCVLYKFFYGSCPLIRVNMHWM